MKVLVKVLASNNMKIKRIKSLETVFSFLFIENSIFLGNID